MDNTHSFRETMQFAVLENVVLSKTGNIEDSEDRIHVSDYFLAVVDGATSKTDEKLNGEAPGRIASSLVDEAFSKISPDATAREAVDLMTLLIQEFYLKNDIIGLVESDPSRKAIASFVAASRRRKEIWLVGDCQFFVNGQRTKGEKKVDKLLSEVRSMYLETELLKGKTTEQLIKTDTGREYIIPLLRRQVLFQNNPSSGDYWFPSIDGSFVPDQGIAVYNIPLGTQYIILASDGYPFLHDTLEQSEAALRDLLCEDPLLFRLYKSTKGLQDGLFSFDDRAYLKARLIWS